MKYAWIKKHPDSYPISVMCDVLDVSASGYYACVDRALSVFKYIETFYNSVRLHQSLGYKSLDKFETEYAPVLAA